MQEIDHAIGEKSNGSRVRSIVDELPAETVVNARSSRTLTGLIGRQSAFDTITLIEFNSPITMQEFQERSAYPHPEEFEVMRPEYTEAEDDYVQATITVAPFTVRGRSVTQAGARRAALYESEKTYRSYHPSYRVRNPFPDVFVDQEGVTWRRVPVSQRPELGDYQFVDTEGEEDYADIENMLMWDIRPAGEDES